MKAKPGLHQLRKDLAGMRRSPNFPPVFVLNLYYSGMGIARNLRGLGVPVYGLSSEDDAPGMTSRFFEKIYKVPNGRDEPNALCHRLLEICNEHDDAPVIFPTRDFDVLFLNEYRNELGGFYRLPENDAVSRILDKLELANIAKKHDISVPVTVSCRTVDEIENAAQNLRFPVVIKPRFAYQWRIGKAWELVGARKAILAQSLDELMQEYHRIIAVNPEVLIQEYVSGKETDIVVCCCYIARDGESFAHFTARKLRQSPPMFGTGCAVEAVDIPEIVPLAARLLRGCGYTGLAEVEFKHDKVADRFYLIEVNPRHWDQHELGTLVGVNLTRMAYADMIGGTVSPQVPTYKGRACRWIAEPEALMLLLRNAYAEVKCIRKQPHLRPAARLLGYGKALRTSVAESIFLLRGHKVFATFNRRDPLPGFNLCIRAIRDMVGVLRTRELAKN